MIEKLSSDIVLGIDGGGTHTRVMVADFAGNVLAYAEKGASSFHKDVNASHNVRQAIQEAVASAGREIGHVQAVVAGIAGYDSEKDLEWVESLTDVEGLSCRKWHVNDAVVAHAGALMSNPGIMVISGTGSIIFAVTEDGTQIRNYDLHHYSNSAARYLAYDFVYEALAGSCGDSDRQLLQSMLRHWNQPSIEAFRDIALHGFEEDRRQRDKAFGQFAPHITAAADQGSRLAQTVCDRAIHAIAIGVEMLTAYFSQETVTVSCVGSVVESAYIRRKLTDRLRHGHHKRCVVKEPYFSATAGAVLMALKHLNVEISDETIRCLGRHFRPAAGPE